MPNHIHLLIKPTEVASLALIMQTLLTSYTMRFNCKYRHCEHLFQGRYKGILVEEEVHLLELLRYIHQNPMRAGLVENVRDYSYSSYALYLKNEEGLIEKDEVLKFFAKRKEVQIERFEAFNEEVKKRQAYQPNKFVRNQIFLGSKKFENKVLNMQLNNGEEVRLSTVTLHRLKTPSQ